MLDKRLFQHEKLLTLLFFFFGCFGCIYSIAGIFGPYISWDSPLDTFTALQVLNIKSSMTLQDAYDSVHFTSEFYGIFIQQSATLLRTLFTNGNGQLRTEILDSYQWQSSVVVALTISSSAALAYAVRKLSSSWMVGMFCWGLLMTTPIIVGMSFVNFKDSPLSSSLAYLCSGLIIHQVGRRSVSRKDVVAGICLILCGSSLALLTRPGAIFLVSGLIIGSLAFWHFVQWELSGVKTICRDLFMAFSLISLSVSMVWLTNPLARINLIQWLFDSAMTAGRYPVTSIILTNGKGLSSDHLPWHYIPIWYFVQVPLISTLFFLFSIFIVLKSVQKEKRNIQFRSLSLLFPTVVVGLVFPFMIWISGSVIYDGIRHVLFIFPALAMLTSLGMRIAVQDTQQRALRIFVILFGITALANSSYAIYQWHPYTYTHLNSLVRPDRELQAWELDYWGTSALEGVTRLRQMGLQTVVVSPTDATSEMIGAIGFGELNSASKESYGLYMFRRTGNVFPLASCKRVFTIERDSHILGEGGVCKP